MISKTGVIAKSAAVMIARPNSFDAKANNVNTRKFSIVVAISNVLKLYRLWIRLANEAPISPPSAPIAKR